MTNTVVDTVRVGPHPFVVRNAFGDLWVGEFQGSRLWRLRPSRRAESQPARDPARFGRIRGGRVPYLTVKKPNIDDSWGGQ